MDINSFFNVLLEETKSCPELNRYYKFHNNPAMFEYKKAYFCQRLNYIFNQVNNLVKETGKPIQIWDCGCGFGTTSLFFAINGIKVHGTTIGQHYYSKISNRKEFWSKYGNTDLFTVNYTDVFDHKIDDLYDIIMLQDTLHHLEPLPETLNSLYNALSSQGKIIVTEANGNNLIHRVKLFINRGNNRIFEIYDEILNKRILVGNENFRSLKKWKEELAKQNLSIDSNVQYIKFFLPFFYNKYNSEKVINLEQQLWKKSQFLREFLFFGINFTISKDKFATS